MLVVVVVLVGRAALVGRVALLVDDEETQRMLVDPVQGVFKRQFSTVEFLNDRLTFERFRTRWFL